METKTIDATGKKLGRVASEAAIVLLGKDSTAFAKNKVAAVNVVVQNASKLDITDKKKTEKVYTHYTGYPGGLREKTMRKVIEKKGYAEILKKAVYGMLPGNKLRSERMKHFSVEE